MTRTQLLLTALIGFSLMTPHSSLAQDKPAQTKPAQTKPAEKKVDLRKPKVEAQSTAGPTGPLKVWIDAENKLIDPLSDKDKESIFILKNKYSMMQATRIVERDIGNAVKACGDKNPDMKDAMTGRFKQWQKAVNPILETAEEQLEKDIDNQKLVDPDALEDVLDLQDEAYEFGEKQTTKQLVTSKEACEGLIKSMDRTEDNMIRILQETMLPESVIRKRAAEQKKAAELRKKAAPKKAPQNTKQEAAPAAKPKAE